MTRNEYIEWARKHGVRFGFLDNDLAMLGEWFEVFSLDTLANLREASNRLLRRPPGFPREHLAALLDALRVLKAERFDAETRDLADDRGTCDRCGGSGRVVVPHPKSIRKGEWVPLQRTSSGRANYYTAAVACRCSLGRWHIEHNKRSLLPLDEYEEINPNWRLQLAAVEDQTRLAGEKTGRGGRVVGERLDSILARLAQRYSLAPNPTSNGP